MTIRDLITGVRHIGVYVDDMDSSLSTLARIFDHDPDTLFQVPLQVNRPLTAALLLSRSGAWILSSSSLYQTNSNSWSATRPPASIILPLRLRTLNRQLRLMKGKGVRLGHVTPDAILDMPRSRVAYFNRDDTAGILIEFVEPRS